MDQIKAVLFDFDGTLVDSVAVFYRIMMEVNEKTGGKVTREDFLRLNGLPIKQASQMMFEEKKLKRWAMLYGLLRRRHFKRMVSTETQAFPDSRDCLERLGQHFRLGLVTSAHWGHYFYLSKKHRLDPFFELRITRESVTHRKPAPEPYVLAAQKLDLPPEACLVIEDSPNGIIAGNRAGMHTCTILHETPSTYFVDEAKPDFFIKTASELTLERIRQIPPKSSH